MVILFCRFGGLGERAIIHALENLGHEVIEFNEKAQNYDYDEQYMKQFINVMEQVSCDIVFSINFLPIISKVTRVFRKKYVSWIYDCPEIHLYSSAVQNENNRIFLFDKIQYERFYPLNPSCIYYMPLASTPMLEEVSVEDKKRYSSDICFIGSLYNEKKRRFSQLQQLPEYLKGYLEGLVQAQMNVFGYNFIRDSLSDELVQEFKKHLHWELVDDYQASDRDILADMYIGQYCSALDRKRILKTLMDYFAVSIYTDSDTSDLPEIDNRGVADSETMMPKIFNCSKINLNITSKTIQSGLPLRIFDVLANKGFLITNYQMEIAELFAPGKDLVVYEDMNDLLEKVAYYMEHEEERQVIAEQGYETLSKNHTYEHRLQKMFAQI